MTGTIAGAVHMEVTKSADLAHKYSTGRSAFMDPAGSGTGMSMASASDASSEVLPSWSKSFLQCSLPARQQELLVAPQSAARVW